MEVAIREGKVPGELAPIAVMQMLGWTWRDYHDFTHQAPAQLVKDTFIYCHKLAALSRQNAK